MEWWLIGSIAVVVLVTLIFIGVPIAFSLGFVSLTLGFILAGPRVLPLFSNLAFGQVNSFVIVAVPLFVFMAEIIIASGVSRDAFDMLSKWMGWIPGGLAAAAQIGCGIFAAVCGASTATTAVIGGMFVPEMLKRGYDAQLTTGSIAAGGALGVLIPPSLLMIVYGVLAQASIGQLFIGGVIPGLMLMSFFALYAVIRCILKPSLGPPLKGITWSDRVRSTWKIFPLLALAIFVFVCIYSGITTATEAAGLGAFASLIMCIAYRRLSWQNLKSAFIKTAKTTSFIVWILVAAASFGFLLSYLRVPQNFVSFVLEHSFSPMTVLIAVNIILIILGCIMDPAGIIMVTVPILAPLMLALGFDLVWFGVMFVVNMELAEITPPLGLNLYIMKSVAPKEITLGTIIRGAVPFMILDVIALVLVIVFPQLVLWLPGTMRQ